MEQCLKTSVLMYTVHTHVHAGMCVCACVCMCVCMSSTMTGNIQLFVMMFKQSMKERKKLAGTYIHTSKYNTQRNQ